MTENTNKHTNAHKCTNTQTYKQTHKQTHKLIFSVRRRSSLKNSLGRDSGVVDDIEEKKDEEANDNDIEKPPVMSLPSEDAYTSDQNGQDKVF